MYRTLLKKYLRIYFLSLLALAALILSIFAVNEAARRLGKDDQILFTKPENPPPILEIFVQANTWNSDMTVESAHRTRMETGIPLAIGELRRARNELGDAATSADEIASYSRWDHSDAEFLLKADAELSASSSRLTTDVTGQDELTVSVRAKHNISDGDARVYAQTFGEVFPDMDPRHFPEIKTDFRRFTRRVSETFLHIAAYDRTDPDRMLAAGTIRIRHFSPWEPGDSALRENHENMYHIFRVIGAMVPDNAGYTEAVLIEYRQIEEW